MYVYVIYIIYMSSELLNEKILKQVRFIAKIEKKSVEDVIERLIKVGVVSYFENVNKQLENEGGNLYVR